MIYKNIKLNEFYPILKDSEAYLSIYAYEPNKEYGLNFVRPAMIVVPGGGYEFVSYREKEPVAFKFLSEGFNCFVLTYSVYKAYPIPQTELACAFDYVRNHQKEFNLNGEILLTGFSAGGHLVGSYGLKYKELENLLKTNNFLKPNAIFMSYPVVNLVSDTHEGTANIISNKDLNLKKELSVDINLTSDYPPVYVWTTDIDDAVPTNNTTRLVEALKKNNVACGFDIFKNKLHGESICTRETKLKYGILDEYDKEIYLWVSKALDFYYSKVKK